MIPQETRGSPSDRGEGAHGLLGLSDNLRGDTLRDCFSSQGTESPKSPRAYPTLEAFVPSGRIQQETHALRGHKCVLERTRQNRPVTAVRVITNERSRRVDDMQTS
jgi:hypothetical protein